MCAALRFAVPQDAQAMLAIYAQYVKNTTASWEYEPPAEAEFCRRVEHCVQSGFPWLVAEENGVLLGYAYAGRYAARRGYDWSCETTVYLSPAAQGRGVAKQLYTALLALLRAQGYIHAYALITNPNPASAAFHKRMGFTQAACLPDIGFKQGQWLGLSIYSLALSPAPAQPAAPLPVQALSTAFVQRTLATP